MLTYSVKQKQNRKKIICYKSFEAARDALLNKQLDLIFLPAAYTKVDTFIQDERITTVAVQLYRIPKLVLVSNSPDIDNTLSTSTTLFLHPATHSLIDELEDSQVDNCRFKRIGHKH